MNEHPVPHVWWPAALRGVGALLFVVAIYFTFSPLLWLPFVSTVRDGRPVPAAVSTFFRPAGYLFDHCEPYMWLVYYEAQILGVDDIDYEGQFLGSN